MLLRIAAVGLCFQVLFYRQAFLFSGEISSCMEEILDSHLDSGDDLKQTLVLSSSEFSRGLLEFL